MRRPFLDLLAAPLARQGLHYGWVVAALAFLTMLSSAAAIGLPGAFLLPLSREFGWDIDRISSALAVRFMLFGLMGPFAAILIERYGLRRIICLALSLAACGLGLAVFMTQSWHLVLLWGVVLGAGAGLTALVLTAIVVNRWFDRHRGLVLGVLTASSATGLLAFLPLATWLIEVAGWRLALLPVVVCCLAVAGLVGLLMCDRPEDMGLRPYGADPQTPPEPVLVGRPGFGTPIAVLFQAARRPVFWVLFGTFFVCGLSTSGLIQTHFITLCGDYGLSPVPAASVLALMGVFDLVGTVLSGWLSDRYDNRKLLFWYYGLRGLSLFWLPHSGFSLVGLSVFAMFYGLDWIATVPPTVRLTTAAFGKIQAGMVFGWIFAGHQIGGAIAAYGAGLSRTVWLTYDPALYAAGLVCLIAALAVFLIRRPAPGPVPETRIA
ncbi:MAG: MFS transporter [Castellaniella sp.]|uniref:MFS transporter n=1 Tax=Castellaniella sp. TaxID=1955812 RepID=UPI003A8B57D7